jgi:hypothetical protein
MHYGHSRRSANQEFLTTTHSIGPSEGRPDGAHLHSTLMPTQIVAPALLRRHEDLCSGLASTGKLSRPNHGEDCCFDLTLPTANHVSPSCLAHGALFVRRSRQHPARSTICGSNPGPEVGAVFALRDNHVPSHCRNHGTVDGVPTPVLYAQDTQVNFIVPWSLGVGPVIPVCVIRERHRLSGRGTAPAVAGTFPHQDRSIVVNQDGTLNSPENPAPRGRLYRSI